MPHIPFRVWVMIVALLIAIGAGFLVGTLRTEKQALEQARGLQDGKPVPNRAILETIMDKRFFQYGLNRRAGLDAGLEGQLGYNISSVDCSEIYADTYRCRFVVSPYLLTDRDFLKSVLVDAQLAYRDGVWNVDLK